MGIPLHDESFHAMNGWIWKLSTWVVVGDDLAEIMQQVTGFVKQTRVRPASWALGMSLHRARAKTVNFDKVKQRTLLDHNFESLLLSWNSFWRSRAGFENVLWTRIGLDL